MVGLWQASFDALFRIDLLSSLVYPGLSSEKKRMQLYFLQENDALILHG